MADQKACGRDVLWLVIESVFLRSPEPRIGRVKENALNNPYALSPPPSQHHLYIISSNDYNVFIVLQCHLKDLLCRKVT